MSLLAEHVFIAYCACAEEVRGVEDRGIGKEEKREGGGRRERGKEGDRGGGERGREGG